MRNKTVKHALPLALLLLSASPAAAGNSLVAAGQPVVVAKSSMKVRPATEWNKLGRRPVANGEVWTLDGDGLNKISFYGGLAEGMTLVREIDRKNKPLPRVNAAMLVTDVPQLVENTYRLAQNTALFSVDAVEPAVLGGADGIRFTYSFVRSDEVQRRGEGHAALIKGKLFLITYEAPALHFFDRDIAHFRQIVDSAQF
jgi:hypothetical protein